MRRHVEAEAPLPRLQLLLRQTESVVQKPVLDELEARRQKLGERLTQLKTESEEIWCVDSVTLVGVQ